MRNEKGATYHVQGDEFTSTAVRVRAERMQVHATVPKRTRRIREDVSSLSYQAHTPATRRTATSASDGGVAFVQLSAESLYLTLLDVEGRQLDGDTRLRQVMRGKNRNGFCVVSWVELAILRGACEQKIASVGDRTQDLNKPCINPCKGIYR